MTSKTISTAAAASISSGVLLCDFSLMAEACEFLMGHPIWTHQYPALRDDMRRAIQRQHPGLPSELLGVTRENYQEHLAEIERRLGKTLTIESGDGLTALLPTDGLPDHLKDSTIIIKA